MTDTNDAPEQPAQEPIREVTETTNDRRRQDYEELMQLRFATRAAMEANEIEPVVTETPLNAGPARGNVCLWVSSFEYGGSAEVDTEPDGDEEAQMEHARKLEKAYQRYEKLYKIDLTPGKARELANSLLWSANEMSWPLPPDVDPGWWTGVRFPGEIRRHTVWDGTAERALPRVRSVQQVDRVVVRYGYTDSKDGVPIDHRILCLTIAGVEGAIRAQVQNPRGELLVRKYGGSKTLEKVIASRIVGKAFSAEEGPSLIASLIVEDAPEHLF